MKSSILMFVTALGLLGFAADAAAMKFKCACQSGDPGRVKTSHTECVNTYLGHTGSVSVQEKQLKVYVSGNNMTQGDRSMEVRFRPRDKKCLVEVFDQNSGKNRLAVRWCNGGAYAHLSPFQLKRWGTDQWRASWMARTSGHDYAGYAIFGERDGKKYMQGLCLENR
ncbi:hypothetical protein MASR1M8_18950 [Thermomonas brevis]